MASNADGLLKLRRAFTQGNSYPRHSPVIFCNGCCCMGRDMVLLLETFEFCPGGALQQPEASSQCLRGQKSDEPEKKFDIMAE